MVQCESHRAREMLQVTCLWPADSVQVHGRGGTSIMQL